MGDGNACCRTSPDSRRNKSRRSRCLREGHSLAKRPLPAATLQHAFSAATLIAMKVEVEKQPGSVSKLQIELPADEVAKEWDAIANSFVRFAKIPGYRPGNAPRAVIDKRFRMGIQDELTKKLVSKSYHEAVEQEDLRVASLTNIEDIAFGESNSVL